MEENFFFRRYPLRHDRAESAVNIFLTAKIPAIPRGEPKPEKFEWNKTEIRSAMT